MTKSTERAQKGEQARSNLLYSEKIINYLCKYLYFHNSSILAVFSTQELEALL